MLFFIYYINIFICGSIGIISILNDELASIAIYQEIFLPTPFMQLFGGVFLAIAITSFLGLIYPFEFISILIFQALLKFIWLTTSFTLLKDYKSSNLFLFFICWLITFIIAAFKHDFFKLKNQNR
jgi:hypothetical protein